MINKRTVFVIGAGASRPYGFPTGEQLICSIAKGQIMIPRPPDFPSDLHFGLDEARFVAAVADSAPKSIDDFLRKRQDLLPIGKRVIASALVRHEGHDALMNRDNKEDWLRYLWWAMEAKPDQFAKNNVAFIIYNYDRCVEHFFTTAMAATYDIPAGQAYECIRQIPMIHPHGMLGPYVARDRRRFEHDSDGRAFWHEYDNHIVTQAAGHIRLFWESSPTSESHRNQVTDLMMEAEYVVFLGFGYLDSNMEHLRPTLYKSGRLRPFVYGTTLGLGQQERARIEQSIFLSQGILRDVNCVQLLKEHLPLHSL